MQPQSPILYSVLSNLNSHPRDKNIRFYEKSHKYVILNEPNTPYISVTTWVHNHFPHFNTEEIITNMMKGKNWKEGHKYWGMTPEDIKTLWNTKKEAVSGAGTNIHFQIECFMNNPSITELNEYTNAELYNIYQNKNGTLNCHSIEWGYFLQFIRDFPELRPYRTEWVIYNEDVKISGSIDMVYKNPDGTYSIYDWKRVENITTVNYFNRYAITPTICHLHDSNYWHYSLQLNTYKKILEDKYNMIIRDLYLVRIHPDAEEKTYELIKLPDLRKEMSELFTERKNIINK